MNIVLAPADPALAEWWYEDRKDHDTRRFNPLAPSTIESLRERLLKASSDLAEFEKADSFFWSIRCGSEVAGHVTLHNINKMMCTAEIGYGISVNARKRGVGTMAVRLLAKNVFTLTPIRKLIAIVHEDNAASRKVLEKAGFKQEGLLREHFVINGEIANEAIYGLLRRDCEPENK